MNIHSRDKSLSLKFCFIIGYPPYTVNSLELFETVLKLSFISLPFKKIGLKLFVTSFYHFKNSF